MSATVCTVQRRFLGLPRTVYIGRCSTCHWRTEFRELATAVSVVRNHVCRVRR